MEKTNKTKVTLGVLVLLATLGLLFLYSAGNPHSGAGVLATAASAQPGAGITPAPAQPADPIYIKFDGIDGESQDRDHKDWIDGLSFSQGQYLPPSPWTGGGARTVVFEEFTLTKTVDKSSPKLAEALCKGTVFSKVDVHVARTSSGPNRAPYYTYELKNVLVTSYHIGGSTQDEVPTESVSLNFGQIKVTYTKFDATGKAEGNVEYSWNLDRNQPQ